MSILDVIDSVKFLQKEVEKHEEGEEMSPNICGFVVETVVHGFESFGDRKRRAITFTNESVELKEMRDLFPRKKIR